MKDKKSYEGHRERLRKRFRISGFEGFHDYEILELLLTYVIPRKDTKPVAKALISKFKSLHNVLDSSIEELTSVEGVGGNSALFLKIIRETIAEYSKYKLADQNP